MVVETRDDTLILSIEDDGPGFPENILHAFEQQESIRGEGGTVHGLGLHFSRAIAEQHVYKGKTGTMSLSNGGVLGGGIVSLVLP